MKNVQGKEIGDPKDWDWDNIDISEHQGKANEHMQNVLDQKDDLIVYYRKFKAGGKVIAVFPEIPTTNNILYCASYSQQWKYSQSGDLKYSTTKPTEKEIEPIRKELESIGYNLIEVPKRLKKHTEKLREKIHR